MKYAFIALIACYLLVYGCGPDTSKKTEAKKEQAVHSTMEKPAQPMPAVEAQEPVKQPVTAAVVETPQPATQDAAAAAAAATPSQPMTEEVKQKAQATTEEAKPQAPAVAEKQKTGEAKDVQTPCPMMTQQEGSTETAQPDEENIVLMPCGCYFIKHPVPANAPCLKQLPPCPMMGAKEPTAGEELVMLPCGRIVVMPPMPMGDNNPGLEKPTQMAPPCPAQPQTGEVSQEDLTSAVQRMVGATNDMLVVTKQLVVATQEMLKATKGAAVEGENTNKAALQAEQPSQTVQQPAADTTTAQPSTVEQEVVNTVKEAVMATQKAIDAVNQTVPKALEKQQ